jgi:hypothetical protein
MKRVLSFVFCIVACLGASHLAAAEDAPAAGVQAARVPAPALSFLGGSGGECKPGVTLGVEPYEHRATCGGCDSPQGSCTPGDNSCTNYCLGLVGEIGFCSLACNCCMCPNVQSGGGGEGGGGSICQPVCRCGDGVSGNQGLCPAGCRQVNCI